MCCAATTCEREFSVPPKKGRRFPRLSESTKKEAGLASSRRSWSWCLPLAPYRCPFTVGNFGEKWIWPRPMMKRPRLQQLVASKRARVRSLRKSPQIYTVRCRSSLTTSTVAKMGQAEIANRTANRSPSIANWQLLSCANWRANLPNHRRILDVCHCQVVTIRCRK